jgi:multidrug efflux system outer membrane protein
MMKRIYLALLVSIFGVELLLSSCSLLGPTYTKPKLDQPSHWNAVSHNSLAESQDFTTWAWWRQFNDLQLNQLIESALQNNNNLQIAWGNMLQAQAALKQIQMGWVPVLNLGAMEVTGQSFNPGFSATGSGSTLNAFQPNNPQNFNLYGVGFLPSYTLNVFEQIKQGEIAKLNVELQQQQFNAVRLGVISQVSGSYFTLLGLRQQLQLQQQLLADAQEMLKYNVLQYRLGAASPLNVGGVEQFIASLQVKLPQIKSDITHTENALQILTNHNPGKVVTQQDFAQLSLNQRIPINLPSQVLKNRPDIQAAEYQLQVANADIGAATAMFFPSIILTGMSGQGSLQLSNLFNAGGDFWAVQLMAALPLLNLSLYGQIDKAKASYYATYYNYVQTVRTAFAQVENGLSNNANLQQSALYQGDILNKAQELIKLAQMQYEVGVISYAETLKFRLNADYALAAANQTRIQQFNSLVNLYQVLGGGYKAESQLSKIKKFNDNHDI